MSFVLYSSTCCLVLLSSDVLLVLSSFGFKTNKQRPLLHLVCSDGSGLSLLVTVGFVDRIFLSKIEGDFVSQLG